MPVCVAHSVNYIPLLNGLKVLSHPLQFARAFVTAASFVLQATSFIALRLPGAFGSTVLRSKPSCTGQASLHSFQSLSVHRLPTFRLACVSLWAAAKALQTSLRQIIYYFVCICFCLVLSACGINQSPFGIFIYFTTLAT